MVQDQRSLKLEVCQSVSSSFPRSLASMICTFPEPQGALRAPRQLDVSRHAHSSRGSYARHALRGLWCHLRLCLQQPTRASGELAAHGVVGRATTIRRHSLRRRHKVSQSQVVNGQLFSCLGLGNILRHLLQPPNNYPREAAVSFHSLLKHPTFATTIHIEFESSLLFVGQFVAFVLQF